MSCPDLTDLSPRREVETGAQRSRRSLLGLWRTAAR